MKWSEIKSEKKTFRDSLESITTRGISILSKFFLLGFLVKELSLSEYGDFQLVSYFILFSTTILGLEYYNLSNRNIVSTADKNKIYNLHFNFFLRTLGLSTIIQTFFFYSILPAELTSIYNLGIIFFISLCDYTSQEIYRYLMINKKFRKANLQLIYKSFFFLIFVILFKYVFKELNFNNVLLLMLFSYTILLVLAVFTFHKTLLSLRNIEFEKIDFEKLAFTIKKLLPFITLVLFVKGIEFSDKFILGKVLGSEEVGVYSFLYMMGSVLNIFIISGFYLIYLPDLIEKFHKDKIGFKATLIKFSKLNIVFSLLLFIGIKVTESLIFQLTGKSEFLEYKEMLTLISLGFFFYNLSLIPHLFLYISNNEKIIMYITGIALVINVLLTLLFIEIFGIFGVAYSSLLTFIFILISKSILGYREWKKVI